MTDKILVPVKIEALIVDDVVAGDQEYNWKSFSIDYEALYTRLGIGMEPGDLWELKQGGFLKKGIHLHWALPAALCNGIYNDKQLIFPAVPNRWLVIRTHIENDIPHTKKWLLESDHITDVGVNTNTWVVQQSDGSFSPSHSIGKVTVLDDWLTEETRSETPLTAVGPGNAAFAALYEHSQNVFGFWDDLQQLEGKATVFSYLVTGWYSEASIDPMQQADTIIAKSLKQKWIIEDENIPKEWTGAILCHGALHSVVWDPKSSYPLPARSAEVNTGVGFTSVEAKSAQLSRQTGAAEKLLNGYLYDGLKDLTDATAIENLAHNQTFSAHDGGDLWDTKRIEKEKKDKTEQIVFPDPIENNGLSIAFQKINQAQQLADKLQQEKKSMMVSFRNLCDLIIVTKSNARADNARKKQLILIRDQLKLEIDDLTKKITGQFDEIVKQEKAIKVMPAFTPTEGKGAAFELIKKKMPCFWKSNNPAVLFSGPGIVESDKYKNPGAGDKLSCRVPTRIVSGISIKDDDAGAPKTITANPVALSLKPTGSLKEHIDTITLLYKEAILMDPDWAMLWGKQYYNNEDGNKINAQNLGRYIGNLWKQPQDDPGKKLQGLICIDGRLITSKNWSTVALAQFQAARGIQLWKHPWTPLYLIWYLKFFPSFKIENANWQYQPGDWEWKDKQYYYKGTGPDMSQGIEYGGKVLLNDLVTGLLQKRLPQNKDIGWHISQALSSFSDALLMRHQCIQIPLLRDIDAPDEPLMADNRFNEYLTNDAYFFPAVNDSDNPDDFFPVSAGHVQFSRLWITDAFGQVKKVVDTDNKNNRNQQGMMHISENLVNTNLPDLIELPPRIVQPARLLFKWCAGQLDEPVQSNTDPSTTPVCGWVLPDHFNQSLGIYEETGEKCGELRIKTINGKLLLQWSSPPGKKITTAPEQSINNIHLLAFVKGLMNYRQGDDNQLAGGEALNELLALCNDRALFFAASAAQQPPGVAGLMGQPLALVLAALQLELEGLPAQPQSYGHILNNASKTNAPGLDHVPFYVSLGDSRNSRDGLVGYFIKDNSDDFTKMHIAFGLEKPDSAYFTKEDLMLKFTPKESRSIILLMDPRGGVQADTAILPSKFIDLPAVYTETQLKNLELDLLVAPFLGSLSAPFIPLGAEPGQQWILQQKNKNGWDQLNMDNQVQMQLGSLNHQQAQEAYLTSHLKMRRISLKEKYGKVYFIND